MKVYIVSCHSNCAEWHEYINSSCLAKNIFHLAGSLQDAVFIDLNWTSFYNILKAKVIGAWNFHLVSQHFNHNYNFVLFSSVVSYFGAVGQSAYAAPNRFLDSLAYYWSNKNMPCLSINWGPWQGFGLGFTGISEIESIQLLVQAMKLNKTVLLIADLYVDLIEQNKIAHLEASKNFTHAEIQEKTEQKEIKPVLMKSLRIWSLNVIPKT